MRTVLSILLFCLTACGGGSKVLPTHPNQRMQGAYHVASYSGAGSLSSTEFGMAEFDGSGAIVFDSGVNMGGSVIEGIRSDLRYLIGEDGRIDVDIPGRLSTELAAPGAGDVTSSSGVVTSDGSLAIYSPDEGHASLSMMIRRDLSLDITQLQGAYAELIVAHVGSFDYATVSRTTFDGGAGEWGRTTVAINQGGVVDRTVSTQAGDYTVDRGLVTLLEGGGSFVGGAIANGEVVVASGDRVEGRPPSLRCYIREAPGSSNASFAGEYHLTGVLPIAGSSRYIAVRGTMSPDGAGQMAYQLTQFVDGVFSGELAGSGHAYAVGSDGRLELDFNISGTCAAPFCMTGALSPSGRFAAVVGTADDSDPGMVILVKK